MTKILNKCTPSTLLGMTLLLMTIIILPRHITAQTLEDILEQRNKFRTNPQIKIGNELSGIAVNQFTNRIYLTDYTSSTLSIVDSNSGNITNNIPVGHFPFELAVNDLGNKIYVANADSNTVSVIDGSTNSRIKDIPVGNDPTD